MMPTDRSDLPRPAARRTLLLRSHKSAYGHTVGGKRRQVKSRLEVVRQMPDNAQSFSPRRPVR